MLSYQQLPVIQEDAKKRKITGVQAGVLEYKHSKVMTTVLVHSTSPMSEMKSEREGRRPLGGL